MSTSQSVQTFGKKKTATAVAFCKDGKGLIRINGTPIALVQPEILRYKVYEPILIAGADAFSKLDIRVRVTGGGHTSQVYAIRQALAKAVVAFYAKYYGKTPLGSYMHHPFPFCQRNLLANHPAPQTLPPLSLSEKCSFSTTEPSSSLTPDGWNPRNLVERVPVPASRNR
ncbi:hypothetical protein PTTG_00989 [Puccinia triticina 1-1 BBBD Race 1]|uniref:40S ribosomal protein S16 n=1 Tax=Puccinia triticina (isolate 1-1 / race 1 (BBBD)) TaxID=630390 RepID=A0A0C4EJR8_PUCT1|nr:hypothetical protein PTTG_00989 [Puccinia triticina 1-1 BBBD Race 1]